MRRHRRFGLAGPVIVVLLVAVGLSPTAVRGQTEGRVIEGIVAVVNDKIISASDLRTNLNLAILAAGLPNTLENRDRLRSQVLNNLVDQILQLQEAEERSIRVTEREIEEAIATIARQNGLEPDRFRDVLHRGGVPISTVERQVRATIAWRKLVQRTLSPSVQIGEEEIDSVLARMQENVGQTESLLAEIFLGVDSPQDEARVRRLAERLIEQIRRGASFPAVSRQFSQAAGAAQGGDLGWIQQGQLAEELDEAIRRLRPGQLSEPIRGATGYHVLLLRDQRTVAMGDRNDVEIAVKQILLPYETDAQRRQAVERVTSIRANLAGCDEFDAIMQQLGPGIARDMPSVRLGELPSELARVVAGLPIGQPSTPVIGNTQVGLFMVCGRTDPSGGGMPSRDAVANRIGEQRIDMLQRRYLRDLRRAAFVDVRR